MAKSSLQFLPILALILALLLVSQSHERSLQDSRQVYMVIVSCNPTSTKSSLINLLKKVVTDIKPDDALVYTYSAATCGFAAKLTEKEAKDLGRVDGVLEVLRSTAYIIEIDESESSFGSADSPV